MTELKTGLRRLLSLGLERQPAADVLKLTLATWFEVIAARRPSIDRLRAGFDVLCADRHSWPAPQHLLAAMPRPHTVHRSKRIASEAARELGMRSLKELAKTLGFAEEKTP